jgi:hypothetical protein
MKRKQPKVRSIGVVPRKDDDEATAEDRPDGAAWLRKSLREAMIAEIKQRREAPMKGPRARLERSVSTPERIAEAQQELLKEGKRPTDKEIAKKLREKWGVRKLHPDTIRKKRQKRV